MNIIERKILIVEDDHALALELCEYFRKRENHVVWAKTLQEANLALNETFDGIILDLILPDGIGFDLLKNKNLCPVVILSTLNSDFDILEGFDAGALDYIVKPCSPEVIETRLAVRLRPKDKAELTIKGLTINCNTRTLKFNGQNISLTSTEFNILWFLMNNAGIFFNTDTIYKKIWNEPSLKNTSIKFHISNLRRKLKSTTNEDLIITQFGKGYAFATVEEE